MTDDPELSAAFAAHLAETEQHERLVAGRLEQLGASPSRLKDIAGAVSGKGFVLFARAQPDTPGKLVAHAFSYEHMELAAYELLGLAAARAGDEATVEMAAQIGAEEDAMGQRLESLFDELPTAPSAPRQMPISPPSSRPISPTPTRSRSRPKSSRSARSRPQSPPSSKTPSSTISPRPRTTSASSTSGWERSAPRRRC